MLPVVMQNLSKRFPTARGELAAVQEVTLTVEGGELFFLLGPSGCGKTTLLRMLAGFIPPSSGRIFFGQRDVTLLPPEKRESAMVFQNYALWPHMTVSGNVGFGLKVRKLPRPRRQQIVREMLQTVRISDKATARPMELSGGQQQRVALARALAVRPPCLLLDEPLSNLDAALRAAMRWEIRRIVKGAGTTAIYVTHDQAEALAIADRIAVMNQGRIVQVGSGRELYENPCSRFVAEFLGQANFLPGQLAGAADQDGFYQVRTQLGPMTGHGPAGLEGRSVTCCIRPESLRLMEQDAPGGVNRLTARLVEWTHLGDSARFRLVLEGGLEWIGAVMPARAPGATDRQVGLRVDPRDVAVLPAE
jgi:iron(III) transport system ATP-binding protein